MKGKTQEITRNGVWNAGIYNTGKTQEVTLFFCFSSLALSALPRASAKTSTWAGFFYSYVLWTDAFLSYGMESCVPTFQTHTVFLSIGMPILHNSFRNPPFQTWPKPNALLSIMQISHLYSDQIIRMQAGISGRGKTRMHGRKTINISSSLKMK